MSMLLICFKTNCRLVNLIHYNVLQQPSIELKEYSHKYSEYSIVNISISHNCGTSGTFSRRLLYLVKIKYSSNATALFSTGPYNTTDSDLNISFGSLGQSLRTFIPKTKLLYPCILTGYRCLTNTYTHRHILYTHNTTHIESHKHKPYIAVHTKWITEVSLWFTACKSKPFSVMGLRMSFSDRNSAVGKASPRNGNI